METLEAIRGRRAINFFDATYQIPDETLKELFEVANLAPSSFNLQPWEVILVTDPANKKKLREAAFNQPKVEDASAMAIIVANPHALEENIDAVLDRMIELGYLKPEAREEARNSPLSLYGPADSLSRKLFAVKNAALFAMNLMIAARGLGLETHPMDGFNESAVKKAFGIPEDRIIPMLIAIGKLRPGITLLPRGYRRDFENFVHREHF